MRALRTATLGARHLRVRLGIVLGVSLYFIRESKLDGLHEEESTNENRGV